MWIILKLQPNQLKLIVDWVLSIQLRSIELLSCLWQNRLCNISGPFHFIFTLLLLWFYLGGNKITELYIPPFPLVLFPFTSPHSSVFIICRNGLFCSEIKSMCHSHWHTILCLKCLKRNKWVWCDVFGNLLLLSHSHPLLLIYPLLINQHQMKQCSIIASSWMTDIQ